MVTLKQAKATSTTTRWAMMPIGFLRFDAVAGHVDADLRSQSTPA